MDTIPFHWDTPDVLQCPRMARLCPDECHEGWLCSKLLCFIYLLATGSAAYHFSQRRSRHRRRNKCPPAAKVQALRGARLKALLAIDFCLCIRGCSCNSFIQVLISGTASVFHPVGNFSVILCAIHLGRPAPPGAIVDGLPCLDVVIFGTSRQGKGNTHICGGVSLPR